MTKRRPSNKKPTGLNKSLGNSLTNDREKSRRSHQRTKYDGNDIENPAFMEKEELKYIDSVTDETSLEEFLAKAQLAGTEFTAEREHFRVIEKDTAVVVPTRADFKNNLELQKQFEHRLRIPRRPPSDQWETVEELTRLENDNFLQWRNDLSDLQEVNGLTLTPYERNPDMWRELWRVVEKSDIIVQIVDARNPLLFRSKDLDDYVREVDPVKQILLLVNKADLLEPVQLNAWKEYFTSRGIRVIFWSALDELQSIAEDEVALAGPSSSDILFLHQPAELVHYLKTMGHISSHPGSKKLVVGMVGYPNVGKSSTINKIAGGKKVSVSATPGKTRHFQTIHIDDELCLCDCPGLVMPSFSFGRDEMFLNGILSVAHMRDHFGPTALLLSRVPAQFLEIVYSIMLPDVETPSPINLLTTLAFMRGFMSPSGIPDCSRAARLLIKDVVCGKMRWVAAPPGEDQDVFNEAIYGQLLERTSVGRVQLQQLEKRGLLDGSAVKGRAVDSRFFSPTIATIHLKTNKGEDQMPVGTVVPIAESVIRKDKKHYNKNKKEKLRRVYVDSYL